MESFYYSDDILPLPYDEPPFFGEEKVEEERSPLRELFPDSLATSLNTLDFDMTPHLELFGGCLRDMLPCVPCVPCVPSPLVMPAPQNEQEGPDGEEEEEEEEEEPKSKERKKRGRPRKTEKTSAPQSRKRMPTTDVVEKKKKKRKCMTQVEKAQHNHLERERRKGMSLLLERLRELVPAVAEDAKASQKKIVDEASIYLKEEKKIFLTFLKEKKKFLALEATYRRLQGHETPEDQDEDWIDEAIYWLEKVPQKKGLYQKGEEEGEEEEEEDEEDEADEEINVEV